MSLRKRTMSALAIVGALALTITGCVRDSTSSSATTSHSSTATTKAPTGESTQTIEVGGLQRTFHVYLPKTLSLSAPVPLVVFLHGGYGSGSQAERSYGWDAEADQKGFVVVYPDGMNHAWNAGGGCCGQPAAENVDDVGFVTAMVQTLEHELPIDPQRVYATGISNGGIMAYELACNTSLFAAIGPDSATMLGPCPSPKPISVIHVHGTADTRIPYKGGEGSGSAHIDGPPVPNVIADWERTDGCGTPTVTTAGSVTTSLASCPAGRAVELITIAGAGHQWPGGVSRPLIERLLGLDTPSTAINATSTIWTFFAAHPEMD
ncbi:MAG TPA: PHB depolymerase family esterase [Acidimicrobiales bacterium]|nr:PHB depolymerase family esterase [Acidimicrobiales bacterium]